MYSRSVVRYKPNYNKPSLIFCQFCQRYYYPIYFRKHLRFCSAYLKYTYKKRSITWNRKIRRNLSFQTHPGFFERLVRDKRVIIVGPSITVEECNLGRFIDSFDTVIRLNKSLPIPSRLRNHMGSRTDILYNSLNQTDYPGENNINPSFLRRNNVKYLRCPYPPIAPFKYDMKAFQLKNKNIIPFGHIDSSYYNKIQLSLRTRPYTGTSAISDLLHSGVKELYVMGIDFYTYGYSKYYRKISKKKLERMRKNSIHRRDPQIDLIKRFYLLDKRFIVDNILDKILLEDYDTLFYNIKSQVEFRKIFISASERYISSDHNTLSSLISHISHISHISLSNRKDNKKISICILGDLEQESFRPDFYKKFDFVIDILPDRYSGITPDINVYMSLDDWALSRKSRKSRKSLSLITQSYKKYRSYNSNPDLYGETDPDNVIFLNPLFSKYLRAILTQTVVTEGKISTEIFLSLVFSAFFSDVADIYVAHMNPYQKWMLQNPDQRQNAISQRMLYYYLLKRDFIKIYNP